MAAVRITAEQARDNAAKQRKRKATGHRSAKSDDIFEVAFGDHAMVIATPTGFHVSEYSHD